MTLALTKSMLTVDWSTGSVGSAGQWALLVSLTVVTYEWGPHVRLNQKKKKNKGKGLKDYWGGSELVAQQRLGSVLADRLGLRLVGRLGLAA